MSTQLEEICDEVNQIASEVQVKTSREWDWRGERKVTRYVLSDAAYERLTSLRLKLDRAVYIERK